jgi:hypothetical protein
MWPMVLGQQEEEPGAFTWCRIAVSSSELQATSGISEHLLMPRTLSWGFGDEDSSCEIRSECDNVISIKDEKCDRKSAEHTNCWLKRSHFISLEVPIIDEYSIRLSFRCVANSYDQPFVVYWCTILTIIIMIITRKTSNGKDKELNWLLHTLFVVKSIIFIW